MEKLEKLEIKAGAAIDVLRQDLGNSYALLNTMGGRTGRYVQRWRVIVNVFDDELLQWRERP